MHTLLPFPSTPHSCLDATIFIAQCFTLQTQLQIECDDDAFGCLLENVCLRHEIDAVEIWNPFRSKYALECH